MICEHYYTIMTDEQVKYSTDDLTFFFCLLFDEYSKLLTRMKDNEFKQFHWTVYYTSDTRVLIHFVTKK